MKHIFFSPDYGALIRSLIICADLNQNEEKIFVITLQPQEELINYLSIPNSKIVYEPLIPSVKKPWELVKIWYSIRKLYHEQFSDMSNANVYFFELGGNPFDYYSMKRLSSMNKLYFQEYYSYDKHLKRMESWRKNTVAFVYKIIYGIGFDVYYAHKNSVYFTMKERFLNKYSVELLPEPEEEKIQKTYKRYAYSDEEMRDVKVLCLLADYAKYWLVTEKDAEEFYERLAHSLLKKFSHEEIVIKYHPTFRASKPIYFADFLEAPSFISAELMFFSGQTRYIITPASLALTNALKVKNLRPIALIDLINISDSDEATRIKATVQSAAGTDGREILIPKSWDEFVVMISE